MKNIWIIATLSVLLSGCKKRHQAEPPTSYIPKKRELGKPLAGRQAALKQIGAEGGILSSDDGNLHIEIPAGALTAPTIISVQAIENTLEGSPGPAYRLLPEGIRFQLPVRIRFSFADLNMDGGAADALRLAYQDSKGYFHVPDVSDIDEQNYSISVRSRHFSDWTIFQCYQISGPANMPLSSMAELRVHSYVPLAPLTGSENRDPVLGDYILADIDDPILSTAQWTLEGKGALEPFDRGCFYLSPEVISAPNPVTVSAALRGKFYGSSKPGIQILFLSKEIILYQQEYFKLVTEGTSQQLKQPACYLQDGALYITGQMENLSGVRIRVNASKKGSFPFQALHLANTADMTIIP